MYVRGNNVDDNGGSVWYRTISIEEDGDNDILSSSTNAAILARSAIEVETNFNEEMFRPTELFIATWDGVGYYNQKKDKVTSISLCAIFNKLYLTMETTLIPNV